MLNTIYDNAEFYTVVLVWITVPLGFLELFLFLHNHYNLFGLTTVNEHEVHADSSEGGHGED